jgi:hypothetical protein
MVAVGIERLVFTGQRSAAPQRILTPPGLPRSMIPRSISLWVRV